MQMIVKNQPLLLIFLLKQRLIDIKL